jgi:glycosyltransferase involved in cell wall biosynthesis
MPLFTIIIPTYNAERTLKKALDSIKSQELLDYEVLIIDGISNDNTLNIIKEYAQKDSRFHWVSEKDKGIYDAMNKGINKATGEWIYFLGSDDYFYNNEVLKSIYQTIKCGSYDVLYGNVFSTRFNGLYDGPFNKEKIFNKNICHQAIFFKRTVFKKIGKFKLAFKAQADWEHNMHWLLSKRIKSKYVDVVVANYADGGFSSIHGDEKFDDSKRLIYLKYANTLLSFNTKLTLFRDELYIKRKSKSIRGILQLFKHLPYVLFPF